MSVYTRVERDNEPSLFLRPVSRGRSVPFHPPWKTNLSKREGALCPEPELRRKIETEMGRGVGRWSRQRRFPRASFVSFAMKREAGSSSGSCARDPFQKTPALFAERGGKEQNRQTKGDKKRELERKRELRREGVGLRAVNEKQERSVEIRRWPLWCTDQNGAHLQKPFNERIQPCQTKHLEISLAPFTRLSRRDYIDRD